MIVKGMTFDQLPADITVDGIVVETRVSKDETNGSGNLTFVYDLSPDNGATWYGNKSVALTTTPTTHFLGSPSDKWGKSSWSRSELQSGNFAIRVEPSGTGITGDPEYRLHFVGAVVHFTNQTSLQVSFNENVRIIDQPVASVGASQTTGLQVNVLETTSVSDGGIAANDKSTAVTTIQTHDWPAINRAAFLDVIRSTTSDHAFSVELTVGNRVLLISEPHYATSTATSPWQTGLLEIPEITFAGAAGVESARTPSTATVVVTSNVLESFSTGDIESLSAHAHTRNLVGAAIKIRAHARIRGESDFESYVLFKGFVESASFEEVGVELSCVAETLGGAQFPRLKYASKEFFEGKGMGGAPIAGADESIIPIGLGRFDATALDGVYAAGHPLAISSRNRSDIAALIPQMLGVLHPVLPLIAVWARCNPNAYRNRDFWLESSLLLYGDLRSVYANYGSATLSTADAGFPNHTYPNLRTVLDGLVSEGTAQNALYRYAYTTFTTYTGDRGNDKIRANPFLVDNSTQWAPPTLFPAISFNNWIGYDFANGFQVIERRDPRIFGAVHGGIVPGYPEQPLGAGVQTNVIAAVSLLHQDNLYFEQDVLAQSTAIPCDGLTISSRPETHFLPANVLGRGSRFEDDAYNTNYFHFGTTSGVLNPSACLDSDDLSSFTTVPNGEILSLRLPVSAPSQGKITGFRVGWLTDGSQPNRAQHVTVAARQHPRSLFPLLQVDINTTDPNVMPAPGAWNWRWASEPEDEDLSRSRTRFYKNALMCVKYDSSSHVHGTAFISARQYEGGIAQIRQNANATTAHGFIAPEAWEFTSMGPLREGVRLFGATVGPYNGDVCFFVGHPKKGSFLNNQNDPPEVFFVDDPGKALHLIAVWLEPIYESSFKRSAEEWEPYQTSDTTRYVTATGRVSPRETRERAYGTRRWYAGGLNWRPELDPRKPDLTNDSTIPVYVSGRGPFGDNLGLLAGPNSNELNKPYPLYDTVTGNLNQRIVERGVDQAAWIIAYQSPEIWAQRAMGMNYLTETAEFGSFEAARFYATQWTNSLDTHRLSTVFKDESTIGDSIDRVAQQTYGFCQEQLKDGTDVLQYRFFVEGPGDIATNQPERLYRGDGFKFTWHDIVEDTFRADLTPLESIANDITLRYGTHLPSGNFTGSVAVNAREHSMADLGTPDDPYVYVNKCRQSVRLYGERKLVVEMPDMFSRQGATGLLRWNCLSRVDRRVILTFSTFINALDIQVGHIIKIDDEIGDRVKYPGFFAGALWSQHTFTVTRIVIQKDLNQIANVVIVAIENFPGVS